MKSYEVGIDNFFNDGSASIRTYIAKSPSKARYKYWYELQDCLRSYAECFRFIKVRSLGKVSPEYFFGSDYDFKRMCEHRNIPFAYMGQRVDVDGKKGFITGTVGFNLAVWFDGNEVTDSNCHPHYRVTYYDEKGNAITPEMTLS